MNAVVKENIEMVDVSSLEDGDCLRVRISQVVDAPWGNSRRGSRDVAKTAEIKASIAVGGVNQSVTVRPNIENNTLELLAGYGRRDLSLELELEDIPVLIRICDEQEARAVGITENHQREDASIVDEIRFSQDYVSLCNGNYEDAAKYLGWTVTKVKSRLKLNDCSDAVLEALREKKIGIGHAEVLSQFVPDLQNGTLAKILDEGWSIDKLKERAGAANRFLRHAKFDQSDCEGCPHNSAIQSALFDNHVGADKCGNLVCYKEKTEVWLDSRKAELEAEHGVVLIAIEKPVEHRRTVSVEVVGEAYTDECLNCVDRVRILQDGINKDCGTVTDDQCVNLTCHGEKVAALKPVEAKDATGKKATKSKAGKGDQKKTPGKRSTLLPAMKTQAEDFVRLLVGKELVCQESYRLAVTLHSVSRLTSYKIPGAKSHGMAENIAELAGWECDVLSEHIEKAIRWGTADGERNQGFDGTGLVRQSAKHVSDAEKKVRGAWLPTKEWLSTYQIGSIESFCRNKDVGFASKYDEINGKGSFEKLLKSKKSKIIETIMGTEFDWSEVVPKEVLDLLK